MRIIRRYSGWLVLVVLILALGCAAKWATPVYRVATGSMQPTMPVDSLVVTHRQSNYQPGDVISFQAAGKGIVTHRLVKITKRGEYITKGDANPTRDYWSQPVTKADVAGKVLFVVKATALSFWMTPRGIGIIICLLLIGGLLYWKIEDEEETTEPVNEPDTSPV